MHANAIAVVFTLLVASPDAMGTPPVLSNASVSMPVAGPPPWSGTSMRSEDPVRSYWMAVNSKLLTLSVHVDPLTVGFVTGTLRQVLSGGTIRGGHLTAGHLVVGGSAVGAVLLTGFLHCHNTTAICGIATLPASTVSPLSQTQPFSLGDILFGSGGGFASFTHTRPFRMDVMEGYALGTTFFVGTEISRTTMEMPEPGRAPLVGACAAALALAAGRQLRRRQAGRGAG